MPTHPQASCFGVSKRYKPHEADQISALDVLSMTIQAECNDVRNNAAAISSLPEEILAIIFEIGYGDLLVEKVQEPLEISVSHVFTGMARSRASNSENLDQNTPRTVPEKPRLHCSLFSKIQGRCLDLQSKIGQGYIGSHET